LAWDPAAGFLTEKSGAFIIGASGGSGVFLAHDATAKKWGGPAFYTIGQASFGL